MKFKIGDVIRLNSEDKMKMTVRHYDENNVECVWYDCVSGNYKFDTFKYDTIRKCDSLSATSCDLSMLSQEERDTFLYLCEKTVVSKNES